MSRLRCMFGVCALILGLLPVRSAHCGLVNGRFQDYGVLGVPTGLGSLPLLGWKETGAVNENLVYSSFGAYTSFDNAVLMTSLGEGIYQTTTGTVSGHSYYLDCAFGQVAKSDKPTVRLSAFNGNSLLAADLLSTDTVTLDADVYGDGLLSSTYVMWFTAASSTTTVALTLEGFSVQGGPGAIVELVLLEAAAVPEPSTAVLAVVGLAGVLAWSRRSRAKVRN